MKQQYLFAFDIDGTLVGTEDTLTKRTENALRRLRHHGHSVSLITGRSHVSEELLDKIDPGAYAVSNGARVFVQRKLIAQTALDVEWVQGLMALLSAKSDVHYVLSGDRLFTPDPHHPDFAHWKGRDRLRTVAEWDPETDVIFKVQMEHSDCIQLKSDILAQYPEVQIYGGVAPYEHYLSVSPKGISKAVALNSIAKHFAIDPKQTIVFGDSDNDLSMFEVAGWGVQVGAAPVLMDVANERVSCPHLGLPSWLERWLEQYESA